MSPYGPHETLPPLINPGVACLIIQIINCHTIFPKKKKQILDRQSKLKRTSCCRGEETEDPMGGINWDTAQQLAVAAQSRSHVLP